MREVITTSLHALFESARGVGERLSPNVSETPNVPRIPRMSHRIKSSQVQMKTKVMKVAIKTSGDVFSEQKENPYKYFEGEGMPV